MEKQSSGEFTPADPAAGAQDAALQERRLRAEFSFNPRRRLQHLQRTTPSHLSPNPPCASRRGDDHVAERGRRGPPGVGDTRSFDAVRRSRATAHDNRDHCDRGIRPRSAFKRRMSGKPVAIARHQGVYSRFARRQSPKNGTAPGIARDAPSAAPKRPAYMHRLYHADCANAQLRLARPYGATPTASWTMLNPPDARSHDVLCSQLYFGRGAIKNVRQDGGLRPSPNSASQTEIMTRRQLRPESSLPQRPIIETYDRITTIRLSTCRRRLASKSTQISLRYLSIFTR